MTLTKRQADVLAFIRSYRAANEFTPTIRQIADHFGIKSPNGVASTLKTLTRKGFVEPAGGHHRGITIKGDSAAELLRASKKRLLARDFIGADLELCGRIDRYLGEAS